jgi:hypothetical protein
MRRETYRATPILIAALLAGSGAIATSCGGDDSDTSGAGGTAGRSGGTGKDAGLDAKGGSGGIGTGGSGGTGGAGMAGKGGTAGTGATGGGAGASGNDGGPRDGASDSAGGAAGKGGAAGAAGTGGVAGTGGAAGTAGAAGSAGTGGTDSGATDVTLDASGGAAGDDGGDGSGGASPDASSDAESDASDDVAEAGLDASSDGDGGSICAVDNAACSNAGSNGLCKSQVCAACIDGPATGDAGSGDAGSGDADGGDASGGGAGGGDDANCATAYGGAELCLSGVCTPGNCRVNGDCTGNVTGPLCGITQPHFCGKCANDAQCLALSPGTPVCNTGTGLCVASAGSCNGQADNTVCSINGADVCCGFACTTGECCPGAGGDTTCKTKLGNNSAVCSAGRECTLCDAVAGNTFIVDPAAGVDNGATGSGTAAGQPNASCAFKTITRALQAVGATPPAGTVIRIRNTGPVSVAGNGETFPLNVTSNVTITSSGGAVTVTPPAAGIGFAFASAGSGINGSLGGGSLVIDGASNTAATAVTSTTGSTATTTLENVTIQNFLQDGIQVIAGSFTIKQGVLVTGSGTTAARRPGLHVTGSGHVDITVPAGQTTTAFNTNTQYGILVDGIGSVALTGSQSGGSGTIETRGNNTAGLAIIQNPSGGVPSNSVTGLLSVGTINGHGIRIGGGSNVKIRSSHSLGNFNSGLIVATLVIGSTRYNSLTTIDLGKSGDPGGNQFQATIGSNANQGAGICLQVDPNTGALSAQGNLFSAGKNCATTPASLTFNSTACSANRDLGLVVSSGGATTGNDIDVAQCTHP